MKTHLLSFVAAAALTFTIAACGPTPGPCSTTSCFGCCDSAGACRTGTEATFCGTGGNTCEVCSGGRACVASFCVDGADAGTGGGAGGGGGGGGGGMDAGALCTATTVACSDRAIQSLDLKTVAAPAGKITTVPITGGFKSTVNATGGGFTPSESYVYARFGAAGLEQVSLSDQQAIDSLDWDIAFRRFVVRINGGDSGPSCVQAAALTPGTTFDSVTATPAGATFESDNFLSDAPTCTFIDDGSGLTTSPSTAMAKFYTYPGGCVTMTERVFVVRTREGREVKAQILTYYATEAAQTNCQNNGTSGGAPGGTVRIQWSYLN